MVVCKETAVEWDTLQSLCDVTGVPTPYVTWLKDGESVSPTLRLSRSYTAEYAIEAEGASLVRKRLQPAIFCEHPAKTPEFWNTSGAATSKPVHDASTPR